jgi:hypothetical protein
MFIRCNAQQRVPEKHLYRFSNTWWKFLEHLSPQSAKTIIAENPPAWSACGSCRISSAFSELRQREPPSLEYSKVPLYPPCPSRDWFCIGQARNKPSAMPLMLRACRPLPGVGHSLCEGLSRPASLPTLRRRGSAHLYHSTNCRGRQFHYPGALSFRPSLMNTFLVVQSSRPPLA